MDWSAVNSLITLLTALGALLFAGLSLNTTRNQLATTQGQIDIAQSQNKVAEQGQFTERYSRAVEQIGRQGTDHLQIRLGGVYALERLAHDSTPDQPTIVEVLSAFVRTTAPAKVGTSAGLSDCPDQAISPDVQAALTIIGRRNPDYDRRTRIDLHGVCLGKAQLSRANLVGADLSATDLGGANLNSANLAYADLSGATLDSVNLGYANLSSADLSGANLSRANLSDANLNEAKHDDATSVDDAVTDDATGGEWW